MKVKTDPEIVIQGANTNNLKNISLTIPHHKLSVITGVSGSGKSSLVFEIIAKEGQRRYFETLPSFARQFMGKLNRPDVEKIEGLSPVIAIGQSTNGMHARSTVGTMSDCYDALRLLFARTGVANKEIKLSRALFSFNSDVGKCKTCNGIGKQEKIDLNSLIVFPEKTIREGALAPTLPNGYIMYSQVTIDVLNQVCEAEGFNVDITWNELTEDQQKIILYGSNKIKVPFGKHSLESRLKWTGIKAKPREEGFYKGMIPIMSDILRRDRNANILKYVHAVRCNVCHGTRLNEDALAVTVQGHTLPNVVSMELAELKGWLDSNEWGHIASEIIAKIKVQLNLLTDLGLSHLTMDRSSKTLKPSEIQRIRIANQILAPLSNVLYVFDEPSIGLHRTENERLVYHFKELVKKGNTVIVVEHNLDTIKSADHIVEIGPRAGVHGGELIFNGPFSEFTVQKELEPISPTFRAITQTTKEGIEESTGSTKSIQLIGCYEQNLKDIDVEFQLGKLNVVSGKSGTGKSSLVKGVLLKSVQHHLGIEVDAPIKLKTIKNVESINKLIFIDHSPIGKTPRSNPATYLGISDYIRDLYASLPESKALKYTKSKFSFNTKGGRCETCQGAGKLQIGMHFLGNIDLTCDTCNGDRFNTKTLEVKYNGLSMADVYRLSIDEALIVFDGHKKIKVGLQVLHNIGLGYLTLGQSSTTLSGGEAQRIKIANQLQKKDTGDTLYIVIEPSIGLHQDNIGSLLNLFDTIKEKGNTIVCIEQNESIIGWSDWHIELGTEGGLKGGSITHQGKPESNAIGFKPIESSSSSNSVQHFIELNGVNTHGLKNINVRIPKNQLTVVTGVSGSGKSSLVYDTLFAESNARFTESLSTYNRSFLKQNSEAKIESFSGLTPAIGINRKGRTPSKRSTVGTLSGVYDGFRLLYSRLAQQKGENYTAQHFSFNHHLGACPECNGLGKQLKCNPDEVISSPEKGVLEGGLSLKKGIGYYTDLNGQFVATLKEVALQKEWNIERPWNELETEIQDAILYGIPNVEWKVNWKFTTKSRTGTQTLIAKWLGFCNYIDEEYSRKQNNKNVKVLEDLLHSVQCPKCQGSRLKSELLDIKFLGKSIYGWSQLSIDSSLKLMLNLDKAVDSVVLAISQVVLPSIIETLTTVKELGLGYLSLDRAVSTLSGGERQRITLAGQLSTHLFGVTYVLDEPTIGLDELQVKVLSKALKRIVNNGNTVVVVEHDSSFIKNADYLIEMGPGAGALGGNVIYQGKIKDVPQETLTHKLFNTKKNVPLESKRIDGVDFKITGANANNLKEIDVTFKSERIIAVKGVSGSGKSTLIKEVLYASWLKKRAINCKTISGLDHFNNVLYIGQEAISENRLSTAVTYTKIIDPIKALFSKTELAQELEFKKADFSYQSKKGKCLSCAGQGKLKTSMDFMSDIWLKCDSCQGMRYNTTVLRCKYKGISIGEVLKMTVLEAILFFETGTVVEKLNVLKRLGLGHLVLGQSLSTLSGGEGQRLRLAVAMSQKRIGKTLFLFDEPSTGLHHFDCLDLIEVFQSIVDLGDTVLFIEHNQTLIEHANQIITLGPGSGEDGGRIL